MVLQTNSYLPARISDHGSHQAWARGPDETKDENPDKTPAKTTDKTTDKTAYNNPWKVL
jgi:hypothetical protein